MGVGESVASGQSSAQGMEHGCILLDEPVKAKAFFDDRAANGTHAPAEVGEIGRAHV